MDSIITNFLSTLTFGELQTFENMGIIPLFSPMDSGPNYVTLKEALDHKFITITEVNQSGHVPELKVTNSSEHLVLLLDGEELIGARQNRVLNTSILLKANSEIILPVSCTEQGRWGYSSKEFSHSDVMMSQFSRSRQVRSVSESLHKGQGYTSHQGRVWDDIRQMHLRTGTTSGTWAMRDVYTARTEELETYLQAFQYVPQQRGCLVFINGAVAGCDVISREAAYKVVHALFVKGYAMDAMLQKRAPTDTLAVGKAEAFLREVLQCRESRFEGVGQGYDYRFEGTHVIGTALAYAERVIHAAFFKNKDTNKYTFHNTTLRVICGSITEVSADALVSSDDNHLTMQVGVSHAILRAAGEQVRQEASTHTPLKIGDVAVTSGGELSAKYIFHAVTVDLDKRQGPSEKDIQTATRKSLELADALGVRRMAFPALGTGKAGVPLELAAEVMTRTITEYVRQGTRIESIVIALLVPGYVQGIALTVFDEHFTKLMSS